MSYPATTGVVQRKLTDQPSEDVIFAVSEISGVDPLDFDQRLHDVIDPDALDDLTDWSGDVEVSVSFTFESCTVAIDGDGITVEARQGFD